MDGTNQAQPADVLPTVTTLLWDGAMILYMYNNMFCGWSWIGCATFEVSQCFWY